MRVSCAIYLAPMSVGGVWPGVLWACVGVTKTILNPNCTICYTSFVIHHLYAYNLNSHLYIVNNKSINWKMFILIRKYLHVNLWIVIMPIVYEIHLFRQSDITTYNDETLNTRKEKKNNTKVAIRSKHAHTYNDADTLKHTHTRIDKR